MNQTAMSIMEQIKNQIKFAKENYLGEDPDVIRAYILGLQDAVDIIESTQK